mmetsp:Transcript_109396/g.315066  ORF Transcript_109396/g.315066 Transcript_109396/m.315066 type:complete len:392 (-) Transcript_109396:95-1270(-)
MQSFAISPYFTTDGVLAALFGGTVLGATVAFKTGCSGGVVGIAGITRGFMTKPVVGKAAFIAGLVLAGVVLRFTLDGYEPVPPENLSSEDRVKLFLRFGGGGLLVGLGTAMANGCTSGHGLTGLARLSPRSWVAVPTFMAAAVLVGTLLGTASDLPPDPVTQAEAPEWQEAALWAGCALGAIAMAAAASFIARRCASAEALFWWKAGAEAFAGFAFGTGLTISTMVRPSKVTSFLDLGSGAWDPSLGFVMGGGLMVTFPFFQILERQGFSGPVLGGAFDLPPRNKMPDRFLVLGSAIFGTGWGVCGLCPGPNWVLLGASPSWETLVVTVGMLIGMRAWIAYGRFRDARCANAAAAKEPPSPAKAGKEADSADAATMSTKDTPSSPASSPAV